MEHNPATSQQLPSGTIDRIGRYQVLKSLGSGACGQVFACHDPILDRPLALKVLHPHLPNHIRDAYMGRFTLEVRVLGRLSHPNVVGVYDAGLEGERPFLAMELCSGPGMLELLQQRPKLPVGQAVWVGLELAKALEYVHAQGIVHRDIKPANLLFHNGMLKLADFGIAHTDASGLTIAGELIGTPGFMAPEQAAGEEVDQRADLYALSVLLFQMLAGRRPFIGEPFAVLYQLVNEDPPSLSSLAPGEHDALDAFFARALARAPNDRFPDIAAWRAALLEIVPETTLEPIPDLPSLAGPGRTPVQRLDRAVSHHPDFREGTSRPELLGAAATRVDRTLSVIEGRLEHSSEAGLNAEPSLCSSHPAVAGRKARWVAAVAVGVLAMAGIWWTMSGGLAPTGEHRQVVPDGGPAAGQHFDPRKQHPAPALAEPAAQPPVDAGALRKLEAHGEGVSTGDPHADSAAVGGGTSTPRTSDAREAVPEMRGAHSAGRAAAPGEEPRGQKSAQEPAGSASPLRSVKPHATGSDVSAGPFGAVPGKAVSPGDTSPRAKLEAAKAEDTKLDAAKPDAAKLEPVKTEDTRHEATKPEDKRLEATKAEDTKSDQTRTSPAEKVSPPSTPVPSRQKPLTPPSAF